MTRPRSTLVSLADTPYYHCVGRCVRRAFLCGDDPVSGRNFDHRKEHIRERLAWLTDTFAIDICAYALMSNHYHLVLRIDAARVQAWTDSAVVERWRRLYTGPAFTTAYLSHQHLEPAEQARLNELVPVWRQRLADLSWFMRCLNEHIARRANAEDGCTGRFWEGRFKSQALLDEAALLVVMTYVDLNPVRAGLAASIEESAFTSGQQRLLAVAKPDRPADSPSPRLLPFAEAIRGNEDAGLPFNLQDYLDLLDTSGRAVHPRRRGLIPTATPKLLAALGLETRDWLATVCELPARFHLFIGAPHRLRAVATRNGWRWVRGHAAARRLYARANE
jgi:REP element-mobilizing transposase RayT